MTDPMPERAARGTRKPAKPRTESPGSSSEPKLDARAALRQAAARLAAESGPGPTTRPAPDRVERDRGRSPGVPGRVASRSAPAAPGPVAEQPAPVGPPEADPVVPAWTPVGAAPVAPPPPPPVRDDPRPTARPEAPRRRRKGRIIAAVVAVVVGLGVVGTIRNARAGVPKPIYLFRADAACGRAVATPAPASPTTYPELAAAGSAVATAADAHLAQLAVVKRPGGAEGAAVDGVVTSLQATRQATQRLGDAARASDDAATIGAARELGARFGESTSRASAYGFTACGTGLQGHVDSLLAGSNAVLKTSYVAKADNLCRAAAAQDARIALPRSDSSRELARYLRDEAALFDRLLADLRALPAPPADEVVVAEMLDAQNAVNAKGRELAGAAEREDVTQFVAAERQMASLITAADSRLDAYGLPSCGSNFGEI